MEINKWHIAILIVAFVLFFLLNNFTLLYMPLSCWLNEYSCPDSGDQWDGNCSTDLALQIQDECCEDVRWCGGTTSDFGFCSDKYCKNPGEWCVHTYTTEGIYKCECKPVSEFV